MDRHADRNEKGRLGRRKFLKSGLVGAATVGTVSTGTEAAPPPAASLDEEPIHNAHGIPLRRFGKTGRVLPVFGFGGAAIMERGVGASNVQLMPIEDRVKMVRYAYDRGMRYFDTAALYDESESIMGQALKGIRQNVYLATKAHTVDPTKVRESVERSLGELETDYVDCVQIHSPAIEAVGFEKSMKLHAELVKLRDEGLLKFIGLTTHVAFDDVHKMISTGGFDQVLLAYGYFRKGLRTLLSNKNLEFRELCLTKAHELGMGIVAMKVMGATIFGHNASRLVPDYDKGKREKLPAAAIRWVLEDERISMLNIGVSLPGDIDQNIDTLKGPLKFTGEDSQLLADFSRRAYDSKAVKSMPVV